METIQPYQSSKTPSRKIMLWTGRIISILCILFLLVDSLMKVFLASVSVQGTVALGFPEGLTQPLGLVILLFTVLYAVPRTAVFGAILLTAHLGGATAIFILLYPAQLSFLFPAIFCVLVWAGLFLQYSRLRSLVPVERTT